MESNTRISGAGKRPRTPTSGDSPTKKKSKSNKKNKKSKEKISSGGVNGGGGGGGDATSHQKKDKGSSTATADGQMMAQMLSTFTKMEQSRFEAFQRSALQQGPVQDWLTACLLQRHGYIHGQHEACGISNSKPRLADMVAPGQANDIGMIVATLAKIYAQRLVATARQLQKKRKQQSTEDDALSTPDSEEQALTPQDIWLAYETRCRQGLDPGFYLQSGRPEQERPFSLPVSMNDARQEDFDQRRLAALAAQEAYDKCKKEKEEQDEEEKEKEEEQEEAMVDNNDAKMEEAAPPVVKAEADAGSDSSSSDGEAMEMDLEAALMG